MPNEKKYFHAATSFQLAKWRHILAFVRMSNKVQSALKRTPGVVTYSLRANPFRVTFLTYTIFESYEALQDLVHSPQHAEAMAKADEWTGPESRTTSWTSESREVDWKDARRRLASAKPYLQKRAPAGSRPQPT